MAVALSWSRIQQTECPYRFRALYIDKAVKEPETEIMVIGREVHEVIAEYRKHCLRLQRESDLEFFQDLDRFPLAYPEKSRELIRRFSESELCLIPIHSASMPLVERKMAFDHNLLPLKGEEDYFSPEAGFRMVADYTYIDQRTNQLVIIDEKTGWADPDPEQLRLYAYLVPLWMGIEGAFEEIVCLFNKIPQGRREVVGRYTWGEVQGVRDEILDRLREVNAWEEFPPVTCKLCDGCAVPDCPARSESQALLVRHVPRTPFEMIPKEITSEEMAGRALEFLVHGKKALKDLEGIALRAFVREHGPVEAAGKVAEERANTPWEAGDTKRIVSALLSFGVPPDTIWKHLSICESAVSKALRSVGREDCLNMVLALGERKNYKPKFGLYSKNNNEEGVSL